MNKKKKKIQVTFFAEIVICISHFSLLIFSFNRDVKERTLQPYS